jgi:AraC-like DNA-binding protein
MRKEFTTRNKWWELAVKSKIFDVLILFDRQRGRVTDQMDLLANYNATQQTMDIVFYIYSNFKEDLSLSLLSETFGLSQNYLSTIIKSSLGLTFSEFLHNLRLKYACTLLVSTAMSVTDVAYASGFQSYRNFVRFFKVRYGINPTSFRQVNKDKSHVA